MRHQMTLPCRLIELVPGIHRVESQQRTIPPELPHQILCVHISVFCRLRHLFGGTHTVFHEDVTIPDDIPQRTVVIGCVLKLLRLVVLTDVPLLEGNLSQPQTRCFSDDRVFDLAELLLL